jgi:hypothetical protein
MDYIKAYIYGAMITTGFVLGCNDLFYKSFILPIFVEKTFGQKQMEILKPRELYGNTAKDAFLDPTKSLKDVEPGEESRDYNNYIFKRKYDISDEEEELLKKNIFSKKI